MSTITHAIQVLIDHDVTRMACMDHDGLCCPSGDAHDVHSGYDHQVRALHDAGLLRRDLEDDFGLSRVQVEIRMDQRTHVIIERGGVPIVNGFIEGPRDAVVHPDTTTTERTCPGGC